MVGRPEPEVDPSELSATVATADGQLAAQDGRTRDHLDRGADGVRIRRGLRQAYSEPMRGRARAVARPVVAPDSHRGPVERLEQVEAAVEVEIDERGTASSIEVDESGSLGRLDERSVRLPEEEVAGISLRVVRLLAHVSLRHVQIHEPVVVDVRELGVPRGRGQGAAAADDRVGNVGPSIESDVLVRWAGRASRQGHEVVRSLTRQVHLRQPITRQVVARDAHALDLHPLPAVARGIEPRRVSRLDPPELLLPAVLLVVVAVVADPEVGTPGAVPRAEQQRQGAPARLEWLRPSPSLPAAFRANELVRLAPARWVLDALVDIVAEGDRRPGVPVLPGGR